MLFIILLGFLIGAVSAIITYKRVSAPEPSKWFPGKVVILTGASEGIGAELAVELCRLGAKLTITARRANLLNETADRCRKYTQDVLAIPSDVSNEDDCKRVVEETVKAFGRLDVIILNAAKSDTIKFEDMPNPGQLFLDTFRVNTMQNVYYTQFSLPHLKKTKGSIVPVSSVAGRIGTYGVSAYSASKHAIHGFYNSLRVELKPYGIAITILPLPYVTTNKAVTGMGPKDLHQWMTPEQCAKKMTYAIASRKREVYLEWDKQVGVWLYALFPNLMDAFGMRFLKSRFNLPFSK